MALKNVIKTTVFAPQSDTIHLLTWHLAQRTGRKIPSAVPSFTFLVYIWGFPTPKHEQLPKIDKPANFVVDT